MLFCYSCLSFRSSSRENRSTVLYSRLDRRSPCFVPLLIGNTSLPFVCQDCSFLIAVLPLQKVHARRSDTVVFERRPQGRMFYSANRLREVYCRNVQRYTPLSTTLPQYFVHHQVIHRLVVGWKSTLARWLHCVQGWCESCIQNRGKFVTTSNDQKGLQLPASSLSPFLWIT